MTGSSMNAMLAAQLHAAAAASPADEGVVELIVRRPAKGEREVLESGQLTERDGLVGDTWRTRKSSRSRTRGRSPKSA